MVKAKLYRQNHTKRSIHTHKMRKRKKYIYIFIYIYIKKGREQPSQ